MHIRPFQPDDAPALWAVLHSSVHQLARQHYSAAQLQAWAPADYDAAQWAERLRANRPWVAEWDGVMAGFADLQSSGYIDQFFVAGDAAGRGVGLALMAQLHQAAGQAGMARLWAHVSLSAELFLAATALQSRRASRWRCAARCWPMRAWPKGLPVAETQRMACAAGCARKTIFLIAAGA